MPFVQAHQVVGIIFLYRWLSFSIMHQMQCAYVVRTHWNTFIAKQISAFDSSSVKDTFQHYWAAGGWFSKHQQQGIASQKALVETVKIFVWFPAKSIKGDRRKSWHCVWGDADYVIERICLYFVCTVCSWWQVFLRITQKEEGVGFELHSSVCHKNNLGTFWCIDGGSFIFGMEDPCDLTFLEWCHGVTLRCYFIH